MKKILSIQSHVAYGYVGNKAAVFPLQRLGYDVMAVNTVQFSNHTGYGQWKGDIFSSEHVQSIVDGIEARDVIPTTVAILSGYMGDAVLGEVILKTVREWKNKNTDIIYCCDPVIGDVGRGVFVKPEVAMFMKNHAVQEADIITPNQFELEFLTDRVVDDFDSVLHACALLHEKGPHIILLTSLIHQDTPADYIEMLVSSPQGLWKITTPKLPMTIAPNGSGDLTAAVFLAKYLETQDVVAALEHVTAVVFDMFKKTFECGTRELQIILTQESIVKPVSTFEAVRVG